MKLSSPPLLLFSSLTQCLAGTVCSSALSSQQPSVCPLGELMVRTVRGNGETRQAGREGIEHGGHRQRGIKREGPEKANALKLNCWSFIFGVICFLCSHLPFVCGWDTSYKNTYYCYRLRVIGGSSNEGSEDRSCAHSAG